MRTDWTRTKIADLFDLPFIDLVSCAHEVDVCFHPGSEMEAKTSSWELLDA